MDAFKAQFERITQQLAALSATQKMLVAALIAVMVMTVLYWGKYAGNAEMSPVLDQVLTDDDIGPIDHQLELAGVPHSVTAGKIYVPTDRKAEILANLMFARVLPQDTHSAFETMSKEINPFTSNTMTQEAFNNATSMELSAIISRFPGVANARVIINAKNETRIEGSIPPSATVFITTHGSPEHPKELVRAAADGVAHAISGLTPSQISVIIDGASMKVPNTDADGSGLSDLMDIRQKRESDLEQKIRNQFSYIPGLTVTVNCDVENSTTDTNTTKYNKDGTVVQQQKSITNSEETTNSQGAPRDPGASANTNAGANGSVSIGDGSGGGAAGGNTSSIQHEESQNQIFAGSTIEHKVTPAGKDSVQSATVRVPDTYFAAIFKLHNPKATDPTPEFTSAQIASIRDGVKKVVGLKSDDSLSVDTYADLPQVDLAMATGPAVQSSALNTVGGHAKEIGVAVLAVVSLLMMATMVRKSAPPQLVMAGGGGGAVGGLGGGGGGGGVATAMANINHLGSGESVAGEVGAGSGALDGMEMDEDSVRTQQMLDQVSNMVKENPDSAANLVKKWLGRT